MNLEEATHFLVSTTLCTDATPLTEALAIIAKAVQNGPIHSSQYTLIARALVDKVAPRLSTLPPAFSDLACTHLESILLNGDAAVAFGELTTAIRTFSTAGADVIARTLTLFVDERLGAVGRLRRVLSSGDVRDYVSMIVHLPSVLRNVLCETALDGCKVESVVEDGVYFGTVAEAVYLQTNTSDAVRDQALAELLRRLVRMKLATVLVRRWLRKGNVRKIVTTALRAPQVAVPDLMHALFNLKCDDATSSQVLSKVTVALVSESPVACEACIGRIPFERPLLTRQRTGLKRIARAVHVGGGMDALVRAMNVVAERWSAEEFSIQADMQLQRQVTRLLLYYLRRARDVEETRVMIGEESLMMILVQGVHHRLGDNDLRIRRHGMIIGEASSKHCDEKKPLKFEREGMKEGRRDEARVIGDDRFEDGGDSDFSELADRVDKDLSDEDVEDEYGDNETARRREDTGTERDDVKHITDANAAMAREEKNPADREGQHSKRLIDAKAESFWSRGSATQARWAAEDDWSSMGSYESSSSDSDADAGTSRWRTDYERIRRKIAAPMSVVRLLGLLREVNANDGGGLNVEAKTCLAALKMVKRLAEEGFGKRRGVLRECGGEVLVEISGMDVERYPDEYVGGLEEAREDAMLKLVEMDVVGCGMRLVEEVICGKGSDVGKRSEGMRILSAGVRGAKERAVDMSKREVERRLKEEKKEGNGEIGRVTRRLSRRRKEEVVVKGELREGWDDEGLGRLFYRLLGGLCEGGGGEFLDVIGRDSQLWASGLLCGIALAGAAGVSKEGCEMREEILRVVVEKVIRECGDVSVRRACALALGAVVESMGEVEVEGMFGRREIEVVEIEGVVEEGVEWLSRAAERDADVGVRRLAGRTLGIWRRRLRVGEMQ